MNDLLHIGDGRYVVSTEGALWPPPPPTRNKRQGNYKGKSPKGWHPPPLHEPGHSRENKRNEKAELKAKIPGYAEYLSFNGRIRGKYGFSGFKPGQVEGYNLRQLEELKKEARIRVKQDMANIKRQLNLPDMADEALEGALTVLREPGTQSMKLSAAKLILEFTKSKPVAKSEVSVNKAEEWLATLAQDDLSN